MSLAPRASGDPLALIAIFSANAINILALSYVQKYLVRDVIHPGLCVTIALLLNSAVGLAIFRSQLFAAIHSQIAPLLAWAFGLLLLYFLLFRSQDPIQVTELVLIQALIPQLAALLANAKKYLEARAPAQVLGATAILLAIGYTSRNTHEPAWVPIALTAAASFISQFSYRRSLSALQPIHAHFAVCTTALPLAAMSALIAPPTTVATASAPLLLGVILGISLLAAQTLALWGVRTLPPHLSALGLSASVPIAYIVSPLYKGIYPDITAGALSIAYVSFVWKVGVKKTQPKPPSISSTP